MQAYFRPSLFQCLFQFSNLDYGPISNRVKGQIYRYFILTKWAEANAHCPWFSWLVFLTSVFFAISHILFNVLIGSTWLYIHSQLENIVTKAVVAEKISARSWKSWFCLNVADNQWETQWRNYYQFYGDHSRVWKSSANEKRNLKSFIQKNHDEAIIFSRFHYNAQHQKLTNDEIRTKILYYYSYELIWVLWWI